MLCAPSMKFEKFQQSSPFTVLTSSFIFTLNFLQRAHLWPRQENKSSYQVASRMVLQSSLTDKRNLSTTEPSKKWPIQWTFLLSRFLFAYTGLIFAYRNWDHTMDYLSRIVFKTEKSETRQKRSIGNSHLS